MKRRVYRLVRKIIREKYLTDWEFVLEVIAPELEEEDFDIDLISEMVEVERDKRKYKLWKDK